MVLQPLLEAHTQNSSDSRECVRALALPLEPWAVMLCERSGLPLGSRF